MTNHKKGAIKHRLKIEKSNFCSLMQLNCCKWPYSFDMYAECVVWIAVFCSDGKLTLIVVKLLNYVIKKCENALLGAVNNSSSSQHWLKIERKMIDINKLNCWLFAAWLMGFNLL